MSADERFMSRALALAARGEGETNPNPMVGCVVVRGGRVVGEGFHRRAGRPHAEVAALAEAGARARGATLYVNLEPCCHTAKRTPPCAPELVRAGVGRVVVAIRDPHPDVSGRGLKLLREAGIAVKVGVLQREARTLNERFLTSCLKGRPFVLLKVAPTLDGRIATASGDSRWITSGLQRRTARRLRRLHDGVLVGVGTALRDDPLLLPSPRTRRPFWRIVLDSKLRLPSGSRLVRDARRNPVVVLSRRAPLGGRQRLERAGVIVREQGGSGRVGLPWALGELAALGMRSVMVEGGSEVLGGFLAGRLFDAVALFRGPLLLGGRGSRPAFGGPNPKVMAEAVRLRRAPAPIPEHFELWYPVRLGKG